MSVQQYKRGLLKNQILAGIVPTDDFILKARLVCVF